MLLDEYEPYRNLLSDGLTWSSQSFGDAGNRAIAFRPRRAMSASELRLALERIRNLFASYDPRPRNPPPYHGMLGEYPAPLEIRWAYDIPYINVTNDHLRATLINYFSSTLPRSLGRIISDGDESDDFVYDRAKVERIAGQAADYFMANHIETRCFMPENDPSYTPETHGFVAEGCTPLVQGATE